MLVEKLDFSQRLGRLTRDRAQRRATLIVSPSSRHNVPNDPADSPVLRAALAAGVDLLVTNDVHMLSLNPYEGLSIISMAEYFNRLVDEGHIVA